MRPSELSCVPDVIHTNGFKMHVLAASIPAAGAGSARVCHMHDYMSGRRVGGALMKVCMGRFDAVVTNSKSVAADIIKYAKQNTPWNYTPAPMEK